MHSNVKNSAHHDFRPYKILRERQGCPNKTLGELVKIISGKKYQISKHLGLLVLLETYSKRKGCTG